MRAQLSNAAYGILDYVAWPLGMLVVAPLALRSLGHAQFGVWMVANAALTIGSIVASGFGDANIHAVAVARGTGDRQGLIRAVRSTLGIHLVLGAAVGALAWLLAPLAASRIGAQSPELQQACAWSLRIAAVLVVVRAIETVCVSTQRAFERYGPAVAASVGGRLLALAAAALGPVTHHGVLAVMMASAVAITASLGVQLGQLSRLLGSDALKPMFEPVAIRALMGFGLFTWIQAVSGVAFAQADRLLTGISFGAGAVAAYALCAQMAQPIYGIAAAGLHFLFPHISARAKEGSLAGVRRSILLSFAANLLMIAVGAGVLLLWGEQILTKWVGASVAHMDATILPLLVWSTALQGLSITGAYTLLAIGQVRWVTFLNLAGGVGMLVAAPYLMRRYGIDGMAWARLLYGPCTLLVYLPLIRALLRGPRSESALAISACGEVAP